MRGRGFGWPWDVLVSSLQLDSVRSEVPGLTGDTAKSESRRGDIFFVRVLSVDHISGEGSYFNFDKVDLERPFGMELRSEIGYDVKQCRHGSEVWRGDVLFWPGSVNGGSVGDSHGRWEEGSGSGQWEALDLIVPASAACPRARGSIRGASVGRTLAACTP